MRVYLPLLQAAILCGTWHGNNLAQAHPGAVADGRATCGTEYSSPAAAYIIPDIKEAWYLRRIATCEQPEFWTKFNITSANQQLYIAVISPELTRFQDRLRFNAILYGPGVSGSMSGLSEVPADLPPGIELKTGLGGAGFMQSPDTFDSCAFVDTNPVMRQFSDLHDGRCMEELDLANDYKDALQAGTKSWSWWLYSYNHRAASPGTYYLQTWLTDRNDTTNAAAQGKYEITLGPWTWYGYASAATQSEATAQGTSCSCAVNALSYKEHYPERLGDLDTALFSAELPGGSCDSAPASACITQAEAPYLTADSAVEWSGLFTLVGGRTYNWTFHSYYQGSSAWGYPDPGMNIFVVPAASVSAAAAVANVALSNETVEPVEVVGGATLAIEQASSQVVQFIKFTDTAVQRQTTVHLAPSADGTYAMFTQHVPSEFMAQFLVDSASGAYVFPSDATLYSDDSTGEDEDEDEDEEEDDDVDGDVDSLTNQTTTPVVDERSQAHRGAAPLLSQGLVLAAALLALSQM